jgi:DNA repair exonuclease SbcCD ATPase subunit
VRILRLQADGFGRLRGEWRFPTDRVALMVDENERGKSTLVAAIEAALYGLEADRRRDKVLTPLDRWRPWDGGSYRVELEVSCRGETYTIRRDFGAERVEVWTASGQDVTEEFREGKDEFPVGQKLLGLGVAEFEKCALVRQRDLDGVVPPDERARRASTLHARLESAVDTRVGDANAAEALGVLEQALRNYTSAELESTLNVENAIKRLQVKRDTLATDLHALEQDFQEIAAAAEELAGLDGQEQSRREAIQRLESRRRAARVAEWKHELDEHEGHATELAQLRAERQSLEAAASLPHTTEAELRETVARHLEAKRNLESLDARRRQVTSRAREAAEAEMAQFAALQDFTAQEADRCVALAADLRRVAAEDRRLRDEAFRSRDRLAAKGFDPGRMQWLTQRFGGLAPDRLKVLREQSGVALAYQTEVAGLEQTRTDCTETLRAIDQLRASRKLPGWVLISLAVAAVVAGGVGLAMGAVPLPFVVLLGFGVLGAASGAVLLTRAAKARAEERAEALRRLSQAQHRLNLLKEERARSEVELDALAAELRYRDRVDLLREWHEYARLLEENEPALQAEGRLKELQEQRQRASEEGRALLARAGGGEPEPAALERLASGIRLALAAREKLAASEGDDPTWVEEKRQLAEMVSSLQERALRLLESVGLAYDPEQDWPAHIEKVAERMRGTERCRVLDQELIPRLERRLLPAERAAELRAQIEAAGEAAAETAGSSLEHEKQIEPLRQELDELQTRRQQLRDRVGARYDQYFARRPGLVEEIQRLDRALERARRFAEAVQLARDTLQAVAVETHRRWADFLNQRAARLLAAVGTRIEQLRFGEDLDFSVKLEGGQQVVRPKADLQLSAGARDQLFLAVRLAVSEYLSRGEVRLPLLLDDPLASSDDERARAAFALLADEVSRQHQVILLTCHRARFEALAARDPQRFAERVQWIEVYRPAAEGAGPR